MAESIPVIQVENLPPDVGINIRIGENLTLEEIYIQQKALETQIVTFGKMVKAHEKVKVRNPKSSIKRDKERGEETRHHHPALEQYYG